MNKNKNLQDFAGVIGECVKCGVCQAHCPTYQLSRREGAVARGKIALAAALLEGGTSLEERLQEDINMCLMCGSCVSKCPNKVPTHEIVGAIRRQITDNEGLSLIGKGVSTLLGSKALMNGLIKGGALLSPMLLKKVPESSGLRLRFPAPGMQDRTVPKIAFRNLFDRLPEFIEGRPDKPVVGFFAGCSITYAYPEIGEHMVSILNRLGFSVYLPKAQRCCGIPALSSGNGKLVTELAEKNVAAFKGRDVQHILTACGSCNGGIGEHYRTMKANFESFTAKVIDFSVFLRDTGLFEDLAGMEKWPERTRVTYHDPCHLKIQGITREPRLLLKALPNVEFVEMADASVCCGLGGTFSVQHYQASKAIGAKKAHGLQESGASMIATACPGCIMQLQDIINHAGMQVKAVHLLELLAAALSPRRS
ncbi:MAG: (Fe-S)-binding protein [Proteobacteria bacterium]|nr:(Fe-S)-binding protein [Pseudomonadota bacterium]